jgi:hypothetical protein
MIISGERKKLNNRARKVNNREIICPTSRKARMKKKISRPRMLVGRELIPSLLNLWSRRPSRTEKSKRVSPIYSKEAKPQKTMK